MITTRASAPFTATLASAPTGLVGQLGVAVVRLDDGSVVLPRATDGIVEPVPGYYTKTLVAPAALGDYVVTWDAAGTVASESLSVVDEAGVPGAPTWAPTVGEVAEASPAFTRGGFDDDRIDAGAEQLNAGGLPTFTADTSPTREHVEGLIRAACGTVEARAGTTVPAAYFGLAGSAAKWLTAAMIASGKVPAGTDDAAGEYRAHIGNFAADMARLIELVKTGPTRLA